MLECFRWSITPKAGIPDWQTATRTFVAVELADAGTRLGGIAERGRDVQPPRNMGVPVAQAAAPRAEIDARALGDRYAEIDAAVGVDGECSSSRQIDARRIADNRTPGIVIAPSVASSAVAATKPLKALRLLPMGQER